MLTQTIFTLALITLTRAATLAVRQSACQASCNQALSMVYACDISAPDYLDCLCNTNDFPVTCISTLCPTELSSFRETYEAQCEEVEPKEIQPVIPIDGMAPEELMSLLTLFGSMGGSGLEAVDGGLAGLGGLGGLAGLGGLGGLGDLNLGSFISSALGGGGSSGLSTTSSVASRSTTVAQRVTTTVSPTDSTSSSNTSSSISTSSSSSSSSSSSPTSETTQDLGLQASAPTTQESSALDINIPSITKVLGSITFGFVVLMV